MPARCSAIAVTGPATPPPMIRTLAMTPPDGVRSGICWGARYRGDRAAPSPKGAHWRWTLGEPGAGPGMHQRAIEAADLARSTRLKSVGPAWHQGAEASHDVRAVAPLLDGCRRSGGGAQANRVVAGVGGGELGLRGGRAGGADRVADSGAGSGTWPRAGHCPLILAEHSPGRWPPRALAPRWSACQRRRLRLELVE